MDIKSLWQKLDQISETSDIKSIPESQKKKPDADGDGVPDWADKKPGEDDKKSKMTEVLKGNQHKIDKNKNGKIDAQDFKMLKGKKVDESKDMMKVAADIETYARKHGGIDQEDMMKVAGMLKRGDTKDAEKYVMRLDSDPRDFLISKMGLDDLDEGIEQDDGFTLVHVSDGSKYDTEPHPNDVKHVMNGVKKYNGKLDGPSDKGSFFKFNSKNDADDFVSHVSKAPHRSVDADLVESTSQMEGMSRAAKGNEKYGKDGMKALAKAGRDGASEKKLDSIRDKHDNYKTLDEMFPGDKSYEKKFGNPLADLDSRHDKRQVAPGRTVYTRKIKDVPFDDQDSEDSQDISKRGRGRPRVGADSDTGEVKNWDTQTLSNWIIGNKPRNMKNFGKSTVHRLKEYMEIVERKTIVEGYISEGRMNELSQIVDDIINGHLDIYDIVSGKYLPTSDLEEFVQKVLTKSYQDTARELNSEDDEEIIGTMYNDIHDIMNNALSSEIDEQATLTPAHMASQSSAQTAPAQTATSTTTAQTATTQQNNSLPVLSQGKAVASAPTAQAVQAATPMVNDILNKKQALDKLGVTMPGLQESLSDTMNKFSGIVNRSRTRRNISESKDAKLVMEGTLEEIIAVHPHEHKMCQEGWGMDESLYEALCDYYYKEARIPRKVWHGAADELHKFVEDCYLQDTQPLMSESDHLDEMLPLIGAVAGGQLAGAAGMGTLGRVGASMAGRAVGNAIDGDDVSRESLQKDIRRNAMSNLVDELDESEEYANEAFSQDDFDKMALARGKRGRAARDNPKRDILMKKLSNSSRDAAKELEKLKMSHREVESRYMEDVNDKEIDYSTLEIDGIDYRDAPDFSDAYFSDGYYTDGTQLSDEDLDRLSDDGDLKYEYIEKKLYESKVNKINESSEFLLWDNKLSTLLSPYQPETISESAKIEKQMINESVGDLSTMLHFAGLKSVESVLEDIAATNYSPNKHEGESKEEKDPASIYQQADLPVKVEPTNVAPAMVMPNGMGMSHNPDPEDEVKAEVVEPMTNDEVLNELESDSDESADEDINFLKKMVNHGQSEVKVQSGEKSEIPASSIQRSINDSSSEEPVTEDDVEEGNEFSGELAKAKASGDKEFEVDGKKYPVKEEISMTGNGDNDEEQSEVSSDAVRDAGLAQGDANFFASENNPKMSECGDDMTMNNGNASDSVIGDLLSKLSQLMGDTQSSDQVIDVQIDQDDQDDKDYVDEVPAYDVDYMEEEQDMSSCNECGGAMNEGHQCSESLNEWANSPTGESEDEQFDTDMDFMTKVISGGLNNQKQDQTTLPSTRVVTKDESKEVDNTMGAMLRKLSGIN